MQQDVGVPLPAGTQWGLMHAHAQELEPVWEEFLRQAADSELFHNDDTAATNMANCNSHGRRGFVTVAAAFPEECAHVLKTMREVYKHDEHTRREAMCDHQRLIFHQQHSGPLMDALKLWMEEKLEARHVEPNSSPGDAIRYVLKRWQRLTLFLHQPGAPLDNNIGERLLFCPRFDLIPAPAIR